MKYNTPFIKHNKIIGVNNYGFLILTVASFCKDIIEDSRETVKVIEHEDIFFIRVSRDSLQFTLTNTLTNSNNYQVYSSLVKK